MMTMMMMMILLLLLLLLLYFIFEKFISFQIQSKLTVLNMFPKFRTVTVFVTLNLKDSFNMVAMYFTT
jgi:hypothetical protein